MIVELKPGAYAASRQEGRWFRRGMPHVVRSVNLQVLAGFSGMVVATATARCGELLEWPTIVRRTAAADPETCKRCLR